MRKKKLENRRNDITRGRQFWSLWYRLEKERGNKEKKYQTGCSYLVTHPRTNPTETGLTLLSGQHIFHSFLRVQDVETIIVQI